MLVTIWGNHRREITIPNNPWQRPPIWSSSSESRIGGLLALNDLASILSECVFSLVPALQFRVGSTATNGECYSGCSTDSCQKVPGLV